MKNLLIALFLVSTIYVIERGQTDSGNIHIYRVCVNGYEYVVKTGGGAAVQSFELDKSRSNRPVSLPIKCERFKDEEQGSSKKRSATHDPLKGKKL